MFVSYISFTFQHVKARFWLLLLLLLSLFAPAFGNEPNQLISLRQSAEAGHPKSQFDLACMYEFGNNGLPLDTDKAYEWYLKSAAQDYAPAMNVLGIFYEEGISVEIDNKKAIEWYLQAANLGYADAMYNVGRMYDLGKGTEKNLDNALQWYTKAGNNNHLDSQLYLADFYYSRRYSDTYKKAAHWYEKAAQQGDIRSHVRLGILYEDGKGVKRNYKEALKWYTQAAELGDVESQRWLGTIYLEGKLSQPENLPEAVKWLTLAAENGSATAYRQLADVYSDTLRQESGIPADFDKALQFYLLAGELGSKLAQSKLADWYYQKEAAATFKGEAERLGIEQNYEKAVYWYEKALEHDDDSFGFDRYHLATIYENGAQGVPANPKKAFDLYNQSAQAGNLEAALNLGKMYLAGEVVEQNFFQCYAWFYRLHIINNQYMEDVTDLLKSCEKALTPEQIQQAQLLYTNL